jgi:hypothetical protein
VTDNIINRAKREKILATKFSRQCPFVLRKKVGSGENKAFGCGEQKEKLNTVSLHSIDIFNSDTVPGKAKFRFNFSINIETFNKTTLTMTKLNC